MRLEILQDTLTIAKEVETIARVQSESGTTSLQDVLRAQIEQEQIRTELENLQDSSQVLVSQLKSALGIPPSEPDPPVPTSYQHSDLPANAPEILEKALRDNPRLRGMQAEVAMAGAGIRLAHLSRAPDFSAGVEADLKASPVMWRPKLGVTLPIWRDKIAAEIAAAQARKSAAEARLTAEQIQLAVEVAERSYMVRETTRNLALLTQELIPKARQALEIATASYGSSRTRFLDLLEAERTLLQFRLKEADALTEREIALTMLVAIAAEDLPDSKLHKQ